MKAKQILKEILSDYPTKYILNRKNQIKEAIKELEELENRSCTNCKHKEDPISYCFNCSEYHNTNFKPKGN